MVFFRLVSITFSDKHVEHFLGRLPVSSLSFVFVVVTDCSFRGLAALLRVVGLALYVVLVIAFLDALLLIQ